MGFGINHLLSLDVHEVSFYTRTAVYYSEKTDY